jgi:hypothetical protein
VPQLDPTIPPPPGYPPTVGRPTTWWNAEGATPKTTTASPEADSTGADFDLRALADRLGVLISETPEERRARQHQEREAAFEAAGETKAERKDRHRAEKLDRQRRTSAMWHQPHGERARRFRRWCALTVLSASAGYAVGLVQLVTHLPYPVALAATAGAWVLDLRMRGWGHVRVSAVRGFGALTVLTVVRIPFGSALTAVLGLGHLFALASTHH